MKASFTVEFVRKCCCRPCVDNTEQLLRQKEEEVCVFVNNYKLCGSRPGIGMIQCLIRKYKSYLESGFTFVFLYFISFSVYKSRFLCSGFSVLFMVVSYV